MQQMKQAKADSAAARANTETLPPLASEAATSRKTGPPPQSPRKGGFLSFLTGKKKDKFEQNPYS